MIRRLAWFLLILLAAYGAMVVPFLLSDDPRVAFAALAVAAPLVTLVARRRVEAAQARIGPARRNRTRTRRRASPSKGDPGS